MIEKMKKIIVVAPQDRKTAMLDGIRDMGVLHVSEMAAPDGALSEKLSGLSRMRSVLLEEKAAQDKAAKASKSSKGKGASKKEEPLLVEGVAFDRQHDSLVSAVEEKKVLSDEILRMSVLRDSISKWGDFDPSELRSLADSGMDFSFYLIGKKEIASLPEDVRYITLKAVDK